MTKEASYLELELDAIYRHWSPRSEPFTGGDALWTALDNHWKPNGVIVRQEYALAGGRHVCVYHVPLYRDGEKMYMRVIENPGVARLIRELDAYVAQLQDSREPMFSRYAVRAAFYAS